MTRRWPSDLGVIFAALMPDLEKLVRSLDELCTLS